MHFVRISKDHDEVIRRLAKEQERSMAWVIKKLLAKAIGGLPKNGRIDL